MRRKTRTRVRRKAKYVWFRAIGSLDNIDVSASPQGIVILDPTQFIFNPDLEGQTVTARRIIVDAAGFSFADISSLVNFRFGVCLIDQNAPNPNPELLAANDARTDWLDLWTSPVMAANATNNNLWDLQGTTIGGAIGAAGPVSFCHRNIKVARRIQSNQQLLWLVKAQPQAAFTAVHTVQLTLGVSILCKLSPPV